MSDELVLLRDRASRTADADPLVERWVRGQLLDAIASDQRRSSPGRRRRLVWVAVAAVLLALGAAGGVTLLLDRPGGPVTLVDKAYAAISARSGIMHFVVRQAPRSQTMGTVEADERFYEEYWIDLAHPTRRRIVQSSGGVAGRQIVYDGRTAPYLDLNGLDHDPLTYNGSGPEQPDPNTVVEAGSDPVQVYRKLLHVGTVESETAIVYNGRPAYRLVMRFSPPYKLVDDVWRGDRLTYIVDRSTYFPLESKWLADPAMGAYGSIAHYPVFEILPSTPQTRKLLQPAKNPQPYRP